MLYCWLVDYQRFVLRQPSSGSLADFNRKLIVYVDRPSDQFRVNPSTSTARRQGLASFWCPPPPGSASASGTANGSPPSSGAGSLSTGCIIPPTCAKPQPGDAGANPKQAKASSRNLDGVRDGVEPGLGPMAGRPEPHRSGSKNLERATRLELATACLGSMTANPPSATTWAGEAWPGGVSPKAPVNTRPSREARAELSAPVTGPGRSQMSSKQRSVSPLLETALCLPGTKAHGDRSEARGNRL